MLKETLMVNQPQCFHSLNTRREKVLCLLSQEAENGRALSEQTVLCSQDRIPIGRIEDTFGPVMCPLYTLRWAGEGDMPPSLVVGAPVFTTQKLAEYLLPEQLYTNVSQSCCICHSA